MLRKVGRERVLGRRNGRDGGDGRKGIIIEEVWGIKGVRVLIIRKG